MDNLDKISKQIRNDIIDMIYTAKSGHPGGSLSIVDILTVLYFAEVCNLNHDNIDKKDRDRLVLSKGHASAALYSTLANAGYFDKELLKGFRNISSNLEGHPVTKVNGVEVCTGSLGQGLSFANGMALASKIDKIPYNVYCILGDGELEEGQVWEAAMTAAQYKLKNVTAFIDYNGLQIDGKLKDVKTAEDIGEKFLAFGWDLIEINGHDKEQIKNAIEESKKTARPTCILCKTIKGKGVSFMEDKAEWHGRALTDEEYKQAKEELYMGGEA